MRLTLARRPEIIALAALIAFTLLLALRLLQPRPAGPVAIDAAAPAPAPHELGDPRQIAQLQDHLRQAPDDVNAYASLGLALLQRVRETADPALYDQAGAAFDAALKHDPQHLEALVGQGVLALARHQFAQALSWGERARAVAPRRAAVYGVLGDAYTELGRYDEAVDALQQMVDIRPDLSSYSRIAYQRELHGDVDGAIEAMQQAVDAGAGSGESGLWVRAQLGNLSFSRGDLAQAEAQYSATLRLRQDYPYAQEGLAHVYAARGDSARAIAIYQGLEERLPLPQFVIALGELQESLGQTKEAARQYDLAAAMQRLSATAGVDVDMELALFEADHGADPAATVARARAAHARRPSIYAADALSWALFRAGQYDEAARYSSEALRLGTRDANLHYHAGMIARARGDSAAARAHLEAALSINPHFSPLRAPLARAVLEVLP
jgi:tetratricopeptide (TPR) repeat protein